MMEHECGDIQFAYLWKLTKIMYKGQYEEIVNWGINKECIEMFVTDLFPCLSTTIDKNMCDMQRHINVYINSDESKYRFEYKEININLKSLEVFE